MAFLKMNLFSGGGMGRRGRELEKGLSTGITFQLAHRSKFWLSLQARVDDNVLGISAQLKED